MVHCIRRRCRSPKVARSKFQIGGTLNKDREVKILHTEEFDSYVRGMIDIGLFELSPDGKKQYGWLNVRRISDNYIFCQKNDKKKRQPDTKETPIMEPETILSKNQDDPNWGSLKDPEQTEPGYNRRDSTLDREDCEFGSNTQTYELDQIYATKDTCARCGIDPGI
eukprot:UN29624